MIEMAIHYRALADGPLAACGDLVRSAAAGVLAEDWAKVNCVHCLAERARDRYWTHGCGADVLKRDSKLTERDSAALEGPGVYRPTDKPRSWTRDAMSEAPGGM